MDYEKMDDKKLVRYLRDNPNDNQGWAVLLERYHKLIWWHIIRRIGEEDHDLYQEIQYAIWDGLLHRYSRKGSVLSYVGGIIVNQVKRRQRMNTEKSHTDIGEIENTVPGLRPSPDQVAAQREATPPVSGMLNRLKPKERKMIVLQYFGYSHREIIPVLGISSVGASRKFLSKLLDRVSEHCQRLGIDADQFSDGMRALCQEGKLDEMLNC